MRIYDYISLEGISFDVDGESKKEILVQLSNILAKKVTIDDLNQIIGQLEDREALSTTAIGLGVAVPHCKSAQVDELQIIIGRSPGGVDFQAIDGEPVYLFFLLIAPEESTAEHLKALAKIARLTKNNDLRSELIDCKTPQEIIDFILEKEALVD